MKDKKWLKEKDPTKLLLKLHEEMGEVTHAYMRGDRQGVIDELDDVNLILGRLEDRVIAGAEIGITYGS